MSAAADSWSCDPCRAPLYAERPGATHCDRCPAHSDNHWAEHTDVPRTQFIGASAAQCRCKRGYVAVVANTTEAAALREGTHQEYLQSTRSVGTFSIFKCVPCPDGSVCDEVGVDVANLTTLAGFWRASAGTLRVYKCAASADGCPGSTQLSGAQRCGAGYTGPLCQVCAAGFGFDGLQCRQCGAISGKNIFIWAASFCFFATLCLLTVTGSSEASEV